MSLNEYHARQIANEAQNQRAGTSAARNQLQRSIADIRTCVENAMVLLDEESDAEARTQLQRALQLLTTLR